MRKSKFSFPKVVTVKMIYQDADTQPTSDTVWLAPWNVPLNERIANRDEWHSIIDNLS